MFLGCEHLLVFVYSLSEPAMPARTSALAPRKHPVQARSVETRARILEAAARVFEQRGYAGTTNQIAAEAGLSVGSLYQYFPNKDSILVELIDRHLADATERFVAAADRFASARSLEERVRVVVGVMVENHLATPRLHQVLFEEAPRPAATRARLEQIEQGAVAFVRDAVMAGDDRSPEGRELPARLAVVVVESLVHRLIASPAVADLDVDRFRDETVRLVAGYLRPVPA
jgi:AcrR family transcriptional regulator